MLPAEHSHVFNIYSDELGNFSIALEPDTKPLWRGNIEFGKLTIYYADILGAPVTPVVPFIYVLEGAHILGKSSPDHVSYTVFNRTNITIDVVINKLIDMIRDECRAIIESDIEDRKFDGTYSLQ